LTAQPRLPGGFGDFNSALKTQGGQCRRIFLRHTDGPREIHASIF
jgi:hypothetical protein